MNVIECRNLTKSYNPFRALDNVSLSIKENTITGVIGRNGAGKTTLLKILAGFWSETSGEVRVFSERPFNNLCISINTIYVDDKMEFSNMLSLSDILDEASRFYPNWDMDFAKKLFKYFSFHPRQSHSQLSKGKQSTFNMIIGLAARTALTIFDEPTTGMDQAVRADFYRALLKDYLANPRTILISSHHLDEIENLIEDVLIMKSGKKLLQLPIDELKEYAIGLTGSSESIEVITQDREVYFRRETVSDKVYAVVRMESSLVEEARQLGIDVSQVSTSELSMYMTNETKGGIDDVFS